MKHRQQDLPTIMRAFVPDPPTCIRVFADWVKDHHQALSDELKHSTVHIFAGKGDSTGIHGYHIVSKGYENKPCIYLPVTTAMYNPNILPNERTFERARHLLFFLVVQFVDIFFMFFFCLSWFCFMPLDLCLS